ncbi:phage tail sheath family protein [Pararobbsia silviterrae]|uniref:Phage tail sheath family protein n=1 Tax=Pararobbsia silviterrae TaxID=1792498 RepID=A0A494XZK3_9BURK|nr:phage tail sheath C-terminal domain-containing protein [Pararobbsia silviterrae]RKP55964.1 phage tail sheath family protein [Pararobbsia silviterrae]
MAVTTTYPGVYIEEDASPSISVSALPTSIPLIAMGATYSTTAKKFDNYLDFVTSSGGTVDLTDAGNAGMRAYFENGGGTCYAVASASVATAVAALNDVTLLVANSYDISAAVATTCIDGETRFAILDGPTTALDSTGTSSSTYAANQYAAVYYPFLSVTWTTVAIAPSAVVAGLYCRNDRTRGVWKSPANIPLSAGYTPKFTVTDSLQGTYNTGKAINMIRYFPDTGNLVWGARTLDDSDDWRYIAVRRLFNSAEADIKQTMEAMVFEPNNQPTWQKVYSAIDNYLYGLWREGALLGAKPEDAYFVQIGEGVTMTPDDIAKGRMIAKVGMAAVRPAEFIILQFTQNMEGV